MVIRAGRCAAFAALILSLPANVRSQEALQKGWSLEVAVDLGVGTKLGGCCVADFDPSRKGAEIGVVTGDGRVLTVFREGDGFRHEEVARLAGEQIQCAAGDLRPDLPGAELVTVGKLEGTEDEAGPGAYHVFARVDGQWQEIESGTRPSLIHAVAVGDFLDADGDELVLGGYYGHADIGVASSWGRLFVAADALGLPGNAKGAAVGAGGVFVACDDGSLMHFKAGADGIEHEVYGHIEGGGLARVAADEHGALICGDDGELRFRQSRLGGGYGQTARITQSEQRLRGAVIADLDPATPGEEFATVGYDGKVRVSRVVDIDPSAHGIHVMPGVKARHFGSSDFVVASSSDKLHHAAAGRLPGVGTALVAVGYSGRVLLITRDWPQLGGGKAGER